MGAGTGTTELRPAPPSSIDPRGIPARATDDVDTVGPGAFAPLDVAQEGDAPPEIPPPSNGAPEDCGGLPEPEQLVLPGVEPMPAGDAAGLMPGVAISVDPSGIPTSGTVPRLSGDVTPMAEGGCTPVGIA